MYNQTLANWHFWLWQIGIFTKVTMMFVLGYAYFPRWVVDYLDLPEWSTPQLILTGGAYFIGLGFLLFIINMAWSARHGEVAPDDPWPVEHEEPNPSAVPAE